MKHKHPCTGCRYFFGAYEGVRCCNYIFVVGHRRPCPPGKECTEHTKYAAVRRMRLRAAGKKDPKEQKKVCPRCGKVFFTTYSNKIYCGEKCRNSARDRRKWEKRKMQK